MKCASLVIAAVLVFGPSLPAQAACYADYKARRDNPLELHYGVARISEPCTRANARSQLAGRLQRDGWRLLNILELFDADGLTSRRDTAGRFFLRY
jgi:hypothetical protein